MTVGGSYLEASGDCTGAFQWVLGESLTPHIVESSTAHQGIHEAEKCNVVTGKDGRIPSTK